MKFSNIKQFPFSAYHTDVSWGHLKEHLDSWNEKDDLILQPDFQRGYVWSEQQQIEFCEYSLRGGQSAKQIYFNNPSWMDGFDQPTECFDGQQRIGAALAFLDDKIKVFGHYHSEYEDKIRLIGATFSFHVFKISDRKELIEAYIAMNTGGTVHSEKDLKPAYEALEKLTIDKA